MAGNRLIGKIQNGVAIDHIPIGNVLKVVEILRGYLPGKRYSLADCCDSCKMPGGKGVLKIEDVYPGDADLNLISVVAPNATLSVIKKGKVESKRKVEIPSKLEGLVPCVNVGCISNDAVERVESKIGYDNGVFTCHYCRYVFGRGEVEI